MKKLITLFCMAILLISVNAFGATQNIYLDNAGAGAGSEGDPSLTSYTTKLRPEASWPSSVTTMEDILSIGAYGIYRGSAGM